MPAPVITLVQWLELQKVRLMARLPFYGILLSYLTLRPDAEVKIAATDGSNIFYNPDFLTQLMREGADLTAQGLLVHETLHPGLGHFWRKGNREHVRWNASADFVINLIVTDLGLRIPAGGLLDEQYRGMSEEEIYNRLPPEFVQNIPAALLDLRDPAWEQEGQGSAGGGSADPASLWRDRVASAAQAAKVRGCLPAGLERMIDRLLAPTKDWRAVLSEFVVPHAADYDWRRPERRFLDLDLYLPSLAGEQVEDLVVAIDTSGSVGQDEMRRMISELRAILCAYERVRIMVMACDADVHEVYELEETSRIPGVYSGGGGTSTVPVFDKIKELGLTPYAVVYLTDGYADYPEWQPEYPVLWVLTPDHQRPPWGRFTVLDTL